MSETPQCSRDLTLITPSIKETKIKKYLHFQTYDAIDNNKKYEVDIFVDGVYNITYFDLENQKLVKNKNIHITSITDSRIEFQYISDNCPWVCLCEHRSDLYKYVTLEKININISQIVNIETIDNTPECKEVTKVSILGISSEFIRSVIIRLRIYKDGTMDTEVTTVDMKVGNRYIVEYFDHKDHTMYEIEGKLVDISIDRNFGDETPQYAFVRPECNIEQVGMGNNAYYNNEHFMNLPKDQPEKVIFIFDTSKFADSTFDHVRLKDIRYVELVKEQDPDEGDDDDKKKKYCEDCPFMNSTGESSDICVHHPIPHEPPVKHGVVNEFIQYDITPNSIAITDQDGNILETISADSLIKIYCENKY